MSRLSKNIIYNTLGQILLLLLSFISVKFIYTQLGKDALGIIFFISIMNTIFIGLLEKGMYATTVREVSSSFEDKPEYILSFIRTGSSLCWLAFIIFSVAIYICAPFIVQNWINLNTMDPARATRILQLLGIASLVAFPRSFYACLLRGIQRMEFNNLIDVATAALQQMGIIIILLLGGNLLHIIYWFMICYGLSVGTYFVICGHFFSLKTLIPGYSSNVIKSNWSFTSKMIFISILSMIGSRADKIIVSKLLPIGVLGYYGFASNAVSKAALITGAISQAAFPSLAALFKTGDRKRLIAQYAELQDLICYITVPLFAAFPFAALPLFTYLFNLEIAKTLLLPVSLLSLGFYMNGTINLPYQFSLAAGKPEISVRSNLYAVLIILPITVLLIYKLKLLGAGLSYVLLHLFIYAYAIRRICRECIGFPARMWYLHVLKFYALAGLIYGSAWIILEFLCAHSLFSKAIAYSGATIFFLSSAFFIIGDKLRKTIEKKFFRFLTLNRVNFKMN